MIGLVDRPGSMNPEHDNPARADRPAETTMPARRLGAMVAAPCLAMLAVGWWLTPNKSGHGTAEQLGTPACTVLVDTGWPCPSCGMTTAVSAAVHGQLAASVAAQPFGIVLALGAAALGAAGVAQAATGRDALKPFRLGRWGWWLGGALAGMLLGWGIVVAVGAANGTLPLR